MKATNSLVEKKRNRFPQLSVAMERRSLSVLR